MQPVTIDGLVARLDEANERIEQLEKPKQDMSLAERLKLVSADLDEIATMMLFDTSIPNVCYLLFSQSVAGIKVMANFGAGKNDE